MNEYDKQAQGFLAKYKIEFHYTNLGPSFKWNMQRYKYHIRLVRNNRKGETQEMTLNFWGSNADYTSGKKGVTAYDVLACISGTDRFKTYQDIIDEFGSDTTGLDLAGIIEESRKMRKFFTPKMLEDLSEIN